MSWSSPAPMLKEDLTITGPIQARLFVSTSGTDSDWVVKLIDVYPDDYPTSDTDTDTAVAKLGGYQQLVRGDVMRGKFRNSLSKPEPFVPGQPTPVNFTLQDVAHTFRAGHKIMVQVQSTWFPIVTATPRSSLTSTTPRSRTSSRPPSASTTAARCRRISKSWSCRGEASLAGGLIDILNRPAYSSSGPGPDESRAVGPRPGSSLKALADLRSRSRRIPEYTRPHGREQGTGLKGSTRPSTSHRAHVIVTGQFRESAAG